MSMTDDWQRLNELELTKGTLQYGQNLQVTPAAGNADLVLVSKDLIRFVGEKTDVNAWRVYLAPWQTRPDITVEPLIATANYADPTPWAPPEPRTFDSFVTIPVYARVQWGSGGIQHTAYIDWPRRGLLFQVSGSYVQVNALVDTFNANVLLSNLPFLQATLAPEPGGGDSLSPATFTYAADNGELIPGIPISFQRFFQIPPFARSFVLIADLAAAAFSGSRYTIETKIFPIIPGAIQAWETPIGGVGPIDQDFGRIPFPIMGQDAGVVRVLRTAGGLIERFGLMFQLDL